MRVSCWWRRVFRFSAEKPRRLRPAPGGPPGAAFRIHPGTKKHEHLAMLVFGGGGCFAFLRKSHGGCGPPPAARQEPPFESTREQKNTSILRCSCLVEEGGFEPPKSLTTDLQSAPFGHSGILPYLIELLVKKWSWWTDSNPRPADYKSAALPAELHQRGNRLASFISFICAQKKNHGA